MAVVKIFLCCVHISEGPLVHKMCSVVCVLRCSVLINSCDAWEGRDVVISGIRLQVSWPIAHCPTTTTGS